MADLPNDGLPENFHPIDRPPIVPGSSPIPPPTPTTVNPYIRGTLPAGVQLQPDLIDQQYTGETPTIRVTPVQASGNPGINAAAQSQAAIAVAQSVSDQTGSLQMPNIFIVGGDKPLTSQGKPITVSLANELPHTFFAGPTFGSLGLQTFDHATTGASGTMVASASVGPLTPSATTPEISIIAMAAIDNVSVQPGYTPVSGWVTFQPNNGQGLSFYRVASGSAVTATVAFTPNASYSAVLAQFFTSGEGITIVQQNQNLVNADDGTNTFTFTNPTQEGSSLFFIYQELNTSTPPTITFNGDTQDNSWVLINSASSSGAGYSTSVWMFYAEGTAGGSDTITFTKAGGVDGQGCCIGLEVTGLVPNSAPPTFRPIAASDFDGGINAGTTTFLRGDLTWQTAVTSIAIAAPAEITVTGSPITTSGTIALAWASESQNSVFCGPLSGSGAPTFRYLAHADLPSDVAYLDEPQTWTGEQTFDNTIVLNDALQDGTGSTGTSGEVLSSTVSGVKWIPAVAPGGSNTDVQFNNSGAFGGSSNLTWNGSTLAVTGAITVNALTANGNLTINAELIDGLGSAGTSGQVLSSTGTGTQWVAAGGGGGGVTSLNSLTGALSITAGTGISVSTQGSPPTNIEITATGGGGGSTGGVNVQTGSYVADSGDNGVIISIAAKGGAWTGERTITINSAKVGSSSQTNFPVLVSGTYSYLATVANGGDVTNSNGYDIIFSSDVSGMTLLSWEIESYDATTGAINFWVKVPTLAGSSGSTVFYMLYGNSAITTFQGGSQGSAWDSTFGCVYHLSGTNVTLDSTSFNNGLTVLNNAPTATTGMIDGGIACNNASSEAYQATATANNNPTGTALSVSLWFQVPSSVGTSERPMSKGHGTGSNGGAFYVYIDGGNTLHWAVNDTGWNDSGFTCPDGSWVHFFGTYNGTNRVMYVNGTQQTSFAQGGNILSDPGNLVIGGYFSGSQYYTGDLDEVRVVNVTRSADWVKAEYNNQFDPSSFYTISSPLSSTVLTLPASPPSSTWNIFVQNTGSGLLAIDPNGLDIDGAGSDVSLPATTGLYISTDGTNYFTSRGTIPSVINESLTVGSSGITNTQLSVIDADGTIALGYVTSGYLGIDAFGRQILSTGVSDTNTYLLAAGDLYLQANTAGSSKNASLDTSGNFSIPTGGNFQIDGSQIATTNLSDTGTGSWTAVLNNVTQTGGSATVTGHYTQMGNLVFFNVLIVPVTSTTTGATPFISGLPFSVARGAAGSVGTTGAVSIGQCLIFTNVNIYLPAWSAITTDIWVSGCFEIT